MSAERVNAVRIHQFAEPQTLAIDTVGPFEPGPGELLVYVYAASINPVDWKIAAGAFPLVGADRLPLVLGRDLAGEVLSAGPGVEGWPHDARVCALLDYDRGAQSGNVIVKVEEAVALPDLVPTETAGALPLAGLTAWQGLFDHGGLGDGQRVLIHGAAGGVGHLAIQFARLRGCEIFATASAADLHYVRDLGATVAIDYRDERFEDAARDVDLVFDTQGGEVQRRSIATLKAGGTLVSTLDIEPDVAAADSIRVVPRWHARPDTGTLAHILDLVNESEVDVDITRRFRLDDAARAYQFVRSNHTRGKVVLVN